LIERDIEDTNINHPSNSVEVYKFKDERIYEYQSSF